jgi:hypothetical protein
MLVLNTMLFFGLKEDVVIENNSAKKGWRLEETRLRIVQLLKEFTDNAATSQTTDLSNPKLRG